MQKQKAHLSTAPAPDHLAGHPMGMVSTIRSVIIPPMVMNDPGTYDPTSLLAEALKAVFEEMREEASAMGGTIICGARVEYITPKDNVVIIHGLGTVFGE